ncbi:uncharacterized protein FIBRA_02604 [Fibroporia radiculosa]|uniref:Uncharacterized protein n=1 Tax=Fibroporia radiculosa TaxID=599839 RepID=J4GN01_9APHY|nr:uncharacterized protein FIBRA_02604 [Fibroporia radiculosa]CCM00570.1 predicted protein [Fibroporia radiculosa]
MRCSPFILSAVLIASASAIQHIDNSMLQDVSGQYNHPRWVGRTEEINDFPTNVLLKPMNTRDMSYLRNMNKEPVNPSRSYKIGNLMANEARSFYARSPEPFVIPPGERENW